MQTLGRWRIAAAREPFCALRCVRHRTKGVTHLRLRLIAPVAVILALAVSSFALAATQSASVVAPIKITVTLSDYAFKFSRASVPKGSTVVFTVKNAGTA